ncbi:MAG: winged helix-turn-helix domain-containing protein [Prevotella sp.]
MTEKKAATKKVATNKTATTKKSNCKKVDVVVNAESVGFRAGDVYQTLAAAEKPLTIAEIAKLAKISKDEAYLGIGWLFKEGKVKGEDNLIALA